jgi:predicted MPP superfamily phosphohydrolase
LKINKILDVFKYLDYRLFFRNNNKHFEKKIVFKKRNDNETTIPDILANYNEIFLKVDIEGDEYKILNDIKRNSSKIIFLVIEFHDVDKNIKKIKNFIKKLDLKIIHIHGNNYGGLDKSNNPKVIELSLLNSKKIKLKKILSKRNYPINDLDYKNFKRRSDIEIKFNE